MSKTAEQVYEDFTKQAKVDIAMIGKDEALALALGAVMALKQSVDALETRVQELERQEPPR